MMHDSLFVSAKRLVCVFCLGVGFVSCAKKEKAEIVIEMSEGFNDSVGLFSGRPIGNPFEGKPWITHLRITDLDADGMLDILACDGLVHSVFWLRQTELNQFEEISLSKEIQGPARVEAVDLDFDGDLDIMVASMGVIFPNNDRIGAIDVLENVGNNEFQRRTLVADIARANDVQAADFDGDGDLDLAIAQFGYYQGEIRIMRQVRPWEFESEILSDLEGGINVCIEDFDNNGTLDIAALISQDYEEIHIFSNDGKGNFEGKIIYGSTNTDYGSSGITLADINEDGRTDILYTNGDGFDLVKPGPRPWHGVQWLENKGDLEFEYHRLGDLPGAYTPIAADVDQDGDLDIFATGCFADWESPSAVSLALFRNNGQATFEMEILAHSPTHLLPIDAADIDQDGKIELVTGGFHAYPHYDDMSRLMIWSQ